MSTPDTRPHLRDLRIAQGWTQHDVADRLSQVAWARQEKPVAANADMVAKWERGVKGVSPRYRKLLAAVFHVTVDQLGLPGLPRGQNEARRDENSLVAMVDQAAELLEQLGGAGRTIRPQVLAALTGDVLNRRTMLPILDTPAPAVSPPDPAELDLLADQYQAAHATAAPAPLMTALTAHLRIVGDALSQHPSAGIRCRLLRNRARVAILAGQIARDDLGNTMAARAYYAQATDDAYELADHPVAAIAHGYAARLAITEGQPAAALRHLDTADHLDVADAAITSWLAATEAEASAAAGDHATARDAIDRAHRALAQVAEPRAVAWFTDHHSARLAAVAS